MASDGFAQRLGEMLAAPRETTVERAHVSVDGDLSVVVTIQTVSRLPRVDGDVVAAAERMLVSGAQIDPEDSLEWVFTGTEWVAVLP
jgi:transcription termination factor Rho